jgi:hypothetical protein
MRRPRPIFTRSATAPIVTISQLEMGKKTERKEWKEERRKKKNMFAKLVLVI